jgi:hypothetical protein
MAKRAREQAVKEKRERKQEKKAAAILARANGEIVLEEIVDEEDAEAPED